MEYSFRSSATRTLLGCLSLLLFGLCSFVNAQDVASLTGVVTDASGAVVTDVTVKLTDTRK